MSLRKWALTGVALVMASPMFAGTYFGGLEDWNGLDYDYNDVVFSLSGSGLSLHSGTGKWLVEPALGTSGMPFWNRSSIDGPMDNVGYCVYGGGTCNGGTALDAGAKYLAANATSSTGTANDVTFSANGQVTLDVALQLTGAKDSLGWYSISDPKAINWLNADSSNGLFSFNPGGDFGLVGQSRGVIPGTGYTYFSQSWYGSKDDVSHFAFFGGTDAAVAPEPGVTGLMGLGLLGMSLLIRKRKNQ